MLTSNITELTHLRQQSAEAENLTAAIITQVAHVQIDAKRPLSLHSDETIQVWTALIPARSPTPG